MQRGALIGTGTIGKPPYSHTPKHAGAVRLFVRASLTSCHKEREGSGRRALACPAPDVQLIARGPAVVPQHWTRVSYVHVLLLYTQLTSHARTGGRYRRQPPADLQLARGLPMVAQHRQQLGLGPLVQGNLGAGGRGRGPGRRVVSVVGWDTEGQAAGQAGAGGGAARLPKPSECLAAGAGAHAPWLAYAGELPSPSPPSYSPSYYRHVLGRPTRTPGVRCIRGQRTAAAGKGGPPRPRLQPHEPTLRRTLPAAAPAAAPAPARMRAATATASSRLARPDAEEGATCSRGGAGEGKESSSSTPAACHTQLTQLTLLGLMVWRGQGRLQCALSPEGGGQGGGARPSAGTPVCACKKPEGKKPGSDDDDAAHGTRQLLAGD